MLDSHCRTFRLLLLAGLILLPVACTVPGQKYRHPAFTYTQVQDRGLAVMGIVSANKQQSVVRTEKWSKSLSKTVSKQREEIPVLSAATVKKELGDDYALIMTRFRDHGLLQRSDLQTLRRSKILSRYVFAATVVSDHMENPPKQTVEVIKGDGQIYDDRVAVELKSRRIVKVSAQVYDLENGRIVWENSGSGAEENTARYVVYHGDSFTSALTIAAFNRLSNGSLEHEPPPFPAFKTAYDRAVIELIDSFPNKSL